MDDQSRMSMDKNIHNNHWEAVYLNKEVAPVKGENFVRN